MSDKMNVLARLALSFLWIFTGLTSAFFAADFGYGILAGAGLSESAAALATYGGSLLDVVLGVWVLTGRWLRACCWVQIFIIVVYTLLLSIIDASYWLHPFGPLTKNIPVLVLIFVVLEGINKEGV